MIMGMLVTLLVGCLLIWAAQRIIVAFAVPEPFGTVIYVVITLIVAFWLLSYAGWSYRLP